MLRIDCEARTRPDPNYVSVGDMSGTDTCPTRAMDHPVSTKRAGFNPVGTLTRHCEVGSGPGSGQVKK